MKVHKDLLRYGNIITDDKLVDENGNDIRIRIVYLEGYYYHKMVNGRVVEIKLLNR